LTACPFLIISKFPLANTKNIYYYEIVHEQQNTANLNAVLLHL